MRMKHSVVLKFDANLEDFFNLKEVIPADALTFTMEPVTEWKGYGPNEREECTGIEFTWETQ